MRTKDTYKVHVPVIFDIVKKTAEINVYLDTNYDVLKISFDKLRMFDKCLVCKLVH